MEKEPIQVIKEYCLKNNLDSTIEKFLLHNYYVEFQTVIAKEAQNGSITPSKIGPINSVLLSEETLKKNTIIVASEIEKVVEKAVKNTEKKFQREGFWRAVWTSIVGSFIFTLLLIIILAVADNQVRDIVDSYFLDDGVQIETQDVGK